MYSSVLHTLNKRWLDIAVGEDSADATMQLPADTRQALYGDIFMFGPAGDTIRRVMNAKIDAYDHHLRRYELIDLLHKVHEASFAVRPWQMRSPKIVSTTNGDLTWQVRFNGSVTLYWLLNGQTLFSSRMWEENLAPYVDSANAALDLLGFPALSVPSDGRSEDWWHTENCFPFEVNELTLP